MDQSYAIDTAVLPIRFVGTGGAFETAYGNSAAIVDHRGTRLLIDCGHAIYPRLVERQLAALIDGVLITHLHDDHVGSLSSLIFYHQYVLQKGRLKLYVPSLGFQGLITGLLSYSLQDVASRVDFRPMEELPGVGFIDTHGKHVPGMQTYGYYFEQPAFTIVYSGDNGDPDFLYDQIAARQLPAPIVFHEVFFHFKMASHAYYQDLMRLAKTYPTYGYHCDPDHAPPDNTLPLVVQFPELNY
jgi:L-ascorbate metabolism protein UlaG (beta-lactamase superfamily)